MHNEHRLCEWLEGNPSIDNKRTQHREHELAAAIDERNYQQNNNKAKKTTYLLT